MSALELTKEITTDIKTVQEEAKADLNFLAGLVSPEVFTAAFPDFFLGLFELLTRFSAPVQKYAVGIPRGFCKTSYIKLWVVWLILFSDKRFILIVGASEPLAINIVADIFDMLSSPNIKTVFGDWQLCVEEDSKGQKVFSYRGRTIIVKGVGITSSVRGVNRKHARPDVMVFDDVQSREDADAPSGEAMYRELLTKITGTFMLARSNRGCTYVFIGNMYPKNSVLAALRKAKSWTSLVVAAITADGQSLWEELKPINSLLEDFEGYKELGQEDTFYAELLNSQDIPGVSGLDIDAIPHLPTYFLDTEAEASWIMIDPSSGKKQGDDCTIGHFSVYDGYSIFDELHAGTLTPMEVILHALDMGFRRNTRLICVEDVAYQSTLLFWFNWVCQTKGISGFIFMPVSPKNVNKNVRIKGGIIRLLKQEAYLHPRVRSLVLDQARIWNPLTSKNVDDILDLVGYEEEVRRLYSAEAAKQPMTDVHDTGSTSNIATTPLLPF